MGNPVREVHVVVVVGVEPADGEDGIAANAHVGADEMAHRSEPMGSER